MPIRFFGDVILKELYEIGIVFRGFVLVSVEFRDLPILQQDTRTNKDLRGAFISAINIFAESAFSNTSLEYLESGHVLFIFKMSEIKPKHGDIKERVILYGLVEKKKKNPTKIVNRFLEKVEPILNQFAQQYHEADFTELNQFEPFRDEITRYFD